MAMTPNVIEFRIHRQAKYWVWYSVMLLYSLATEVRATVAAATGVVIEDRARLLEFQLVP